MSGKPSPPPSLERGASLCKHVGMGKLMLIAAVAAVLPFTFNANAQEKKADKASENKKKEGKTRGADGASKDTRKGTEATEVRPAESARPTK